MNTNWRRTWVRRVLLLLGAVAVMTAAQAQGSIRPEIMQRSGYTAGQWAMLPQWCRFTQDNPESARTGVTWDRMPGVERWLGLLGPDMVHLHHFCRGLRYQLMHDTIPDLTPRERLTLNLAVVDEMNYILKTCQPGMPLFPEVLLRKGDAEVRMENLPAAQASYAASRKIKPDYWPAYTRWADVLVKLKRNDLALQLIEEGLQHAPDAAELLSRRQALGGGARVQAAARPARAAASAASSSAQ